MTAKRQYEGPSSMLGGFSWIPLCTVPTAIVRCQLRTIYRRDIVPFIEVARNDSHHRLYIFNSSCNRPSLILSPRNRNPATNKPMSRPKPHQVTRGRRASHLRLETSKDIQSSLYLCQCRPWQSWRQRWHPFRLR